MTRLLVSCRCHQFAFQVPYLVYWFCCWGEKTDDDDDKAGAQSLVWPPLRLLAGGAKAWHCCPSQSSPMSSPAVRLCPSQALIFRSQSSGKSQHKPNIRVKLLWSSFHLDIEVVFYLYLDQNTFLNWLRQKLGVTIVHDRVRLASAYIAVPLHCALKRE